MKLLLIGLDGLRVDMALPQAVASDQRFARPHHDADPRFSSGGADHTLSAPQVAAWGRLAPTMERLAQPGERSDGLVLPVWMTPPTDSGPGWSSLLTGSTHEQCNVWWNEFVGHRLAVRPDLLTRVWAANPLARTLAAASWPALVSAHGPGPVLQTRPEQQATGQYRVLESTSQDLRLADQELTARAGWVLNHEGPDAAFVYLQNTDAVAHREGASSEAYRQAIRDADEHVRYLVKAVAERHEQLGEDWLVAITTDHGHKPEGGHGEDEVEVRRSFLLLHRIGSALPPSAAVSNALFAHEVAPHLLDLIGVQQGSWTPTHDVGVARDVPSVGPTRNLDFEW